MAVLRYPQGGADSSAIVYSIVETAKANGLDPYTYLKLLLTELPYLGKNPASDKLDLFMPWTAAIRKNCILPTKNFTRGPLTRGPRASSCYRMIIEHLR